MENKTGNKFYFASGALLLSLIVFLVTAAPGVTFTDAGELAGVCTSLGVAHPTGYPLFTILGHLWTLLPIAESPVFELNLFAGLLVSIAVFTLFFFFANIISYFYKQAKIPISPLSINIISFAGAVGIAFASVIWDQATAVEVYSLHLLMLSLILHFSFKAYISENNTEKLFFLTAFFIGLSFANHMTTLLVLPAVFYLFFASGGKPYFTQKRFKALGILIIPLFIGLSLYIYLPLISSTNPLFNWGDVSRGFDKFLYHVQGKQYQIWMFSDSESWSKNFVKFINSLPSQTAWIGLVFAFGGMYFALRYAKRLFWLSVIIIISCLGYSLNYSIHDIETYFLSAYIGMYILIVIGMAGLLKNKNYSYFALVIPVLLVVMNFSYNDRSNERYVDEYTKVMTGGLAEDALIISSEWDMWCSAFWYYQGIEGHRKDIQLVELELMRRTWYPTMIKRWYPPLYKQCESNFESYLEILEKFESSHPYDPREIQQQFVGLFRCMIDNNIDERPIYVTHDIMQNEPQIVQGYTAMPEGLAVRLYKNAQSPQFNPGELDLTGFIASIGPRSNHLTKATANNLLSKLNTLHRFALKYQKPELAQAYNTQIRAINEKLK